MQGNIAGLPATSQPAMNAAGTDTVDVTGLGAGEILVLAGHMSARATAAHREDRGCMFDLTHIVRGLHVFGRKVLRPEALVRSVITCKGEA